MSLKRIAICFAILAALAVGGSHFVPAAHAQTETAMTGLQAVGGTIALPDTDPRVLAGRIINVVLGTLGIIFLIIIVYAGFLYLTSGGNPAKTEAARLWIRNGVIGLIIILSSWAIAHYVIQKLIEAATEAGGGGGGPGGGGGGGGFTPGGSSTALRVVSISPNGSIGNRKVVVKIVFSLPLSDASAASPDAVIVERTDGTRITGTIAHPAPNRLFFTPSAPCPAPNGDRSCFDENTDFRVRANDAVLTGSGAQPLRCGGFYPSCESTFRTGSEVDLSPPSVSMSSPVDGAAVPADSLVDLFANASDNVALGFVSFAVNGEVVGEDAPGSSASSFGAHVRWDTAGIPAGETRTITATAFDTDTGRTESAPISVHVRAAHCFNGTQDQGETGIDCGGESNSADYCGACGGGACTTGSDCASGVCANGVCIDQPIITSVVPDNGAVGSLITINGYNFGSTGNVLFLGPPGSTPVAAIPPPACVEAGVWTWARRQVVVEVPVGAQNGPIRLTNSNSGLSDDTNVPADGALPDFVVNDVLRPGLCAVRPSGAAPSSPMTLYGSGFGNSSGIVQFGAQSLVPAAWADRTIESAYPNVPVGSYDVAVNANGVVSNPMTVDVYPAEGGGTPEIVEISPGSGPSGQYVTITGRNFGSSVGTVFFQETASGQNVPADTNFPAACASAFWHNTSITVKVPSSLTSGGGPLPTGAYAVYVRTARPTAPESNRVDFLVNTETAVPGLCAISPRIGPAGTSVTLYGERLGNGGSLVYSNHVIGATSGWNDGRIASRIPSGAQTGPVHVEIPAGGGSTVSSNGVLLEVRNCNEASNVCAEGEACCSDGACHLPTCSGGTCTPAVCEAGPAPGVFAWQFSTGLIPRAPHVVVQCGNTDLPSPTPWSGRDGGNDACVNAQIGILFSTHLDPASVTNDAINVFQCTGTGSNPCASRTEAPVTILPIESADGSAGEGRDYVRIQPGSLNPSTTYEVILSTAIRGLGEAGAPMEEDSTRCGEGNAYCFQFKTRADAAPCAVASVLVAPGSFTATEQSQKIAYSAVPRPSDICQIMDCEPYDWHWAASIARASITNVVEGGRGSCHQTATAQMETEPGAPVQIQATESASHSTGAGDLTISFADPEVVHYGPDCKAACTNALVWATFNIPINPSTVTPSNVQIVPCTHENCREVGAPLAIPAANMTMQTVPGTVDGKLRQLVITPRNGTANLLQPGRFYRVILRGGPSGLRSGNGSALAHLNYASPSGFSWTFATRSGTGAVCVAERIDVAPGEKFESIVGARQLFTATPYAKSDECSSNGQAVMVDQGYAWASSRPEVAAFLPGVIDTGAQVPAGCRANCTLLGADGVYRQTAQCGNGRVEGTDAAYLNRYQSQGGTRPHDHLASGGAGGEECDGEAGCNSACLWDPVAAVGAGGTCGNGIVNFMEDCDPGRVCTGTLPTSTTPPGSDCTSDANAARCVANHGTCAPADLRGCSSGCRNLGSRAGESTCGNKDISDGEDCDDGNTASGDGCSADCLHEGSQSTILALCGNGTLEPGEACELQSGHFPAGCDSKTCLRAGTKACSAVSGAHPCCGNGGAPEAGEDCDDGNENSGDGCSAACLFEGSSVLDAYAQPSFCGDGDVGTGESPLCEQAGGDGRVDAVQLATIVGNASPDASGRMSSQLSAAIGTVSGQATYGLQCGFTSEEFCAGATGLTDQGCCSLRPHLDSVFPSNGATDVCRNVLVSGAFNVEMDEKSVSENFLIARRVQGASCPSGEEVVLLDGSKPPAGIKGFFVRVWQKILAFFGRPAHAQSAVWCRGSVTGTMTVTAGTHLVGGVEVPNSTFAFTLDHALEPNTRYIVQFTGDTKEGGLLDNADLAKKFGMKSKSGVVMSHDYSLTFTTGQEICALNSVAVTDETAGHPFLFTSARETHPFVAHAQSVRGGQAYPISATAEYAWEWENWTVSNANIATLNPSAAPAPANRLSADARSVISTTNSGTAYVTARAHIVTDNVQNPSTVGAVVSGAEKITALICENPWPSRQAAPFTDAAGSPALAGTIFQNGPYFNFSMMYCRDAGAPGPNEDIPALIINPVPMNDTQRQKGILREYLFTFQDSSQARDAIGVRIMDNPQHYGIADWYRAKGFTGKPALTTVDGYPALREGRTVYIGAVSTEGPGYPLYSNVYVISYNDDATPVTRGIFDALLESLAFNVNLTTGVSGACMDAGGSLVLDEKREPALCSADWQCGAYGTGFACDNFKAKLQRDLVRIGDFQVISSALAAVKARDGKYPSVSEGSYLAGFTTSLWPSWRDAFQKAINPASGSLPLDPVNRFVTCGRCAKTGMICSVNADCSSQGDTCAPVGGYDPLTCWNDQARAYLCPLEGGENSSHLYTYQSLENGARFELAAEFEVPPPNAADPSSGWWSPPLFDEVRQCVTAAEAGRACNGDADCRTCPMGVCTGVPTVAGSCRSVGGRYRYANLCNGGSYGESSTCGDGVIDANPQHNKCLGGSRDGQSCSASGDCPGGVCAAAEICETKGPSASRDAACTTTGGSAGTKKQICSGCRSYVDDPANPGCFADRSCGNGRVDQGHCSENASVGCVTTQNCRDRYAAELQQALASLGYSVNMTGTYDGQTGNAVRAFQTAQHIQIDGIAGPETIGTLKTVLQSQGLGCADPNACFTNYAGYQCVGGGEICDDGAQNGTYGHCNLACSGFGGYCGDGMASLGEACDFGFGGTPANGGYCSESSCTTANSCNLSCSGVGPRCGDGNVDAQEECDGAPLITEKGVCSDRRTPCSSNADCPSGETCTYRAACPVARVCGTGGAMKGQICTTNSDCDGGVCGAQPVQTYRRLNCSNACRYYVSWETCTGKEYCGNGVTDPGEECDDGNAVDTDGCTASCKKSVCGDGYLYEGVEECDLGSGSHGNGAACMSTEYGSTCTSCSSACKYQLTQGGFCGNGVVEEGSAEQCDTAGDLTEYAFASHEIPYRSCRALGYDYALAAYNSSHDFITCSASCGFAGCAMCGDPPPAGSADNAMYQGVIEAELYDTLFQQPVQDARVTLFYRGLQVAVTTSDERGFFRFSGLDRHDGCNQYKLIVDSYADNPLTPLFDESKRGGYMPIETPPFQPHQNVADETNRSGRFTDVVLEWGNASKRTVGDATVTGYTIPRFNMLPRLKENEYIVQFWWNPFGGSVSETIQDFRDNVQPGHGTMSQQVARAGEYYSDHASSLHDLVIRLPFTYVPGSFGRCTLSPRPEAYEGDGRNKGLDDDEQFIYKDPAPAYDSANPWASYLWQPGVSGVDHQDPLFGMVNCTNKIRATSGRTCTDGDVPAGLEGKLACSADWECTGYQSERYNFGSDAMCSGDPEPSRSGPISVLEGQEGAYLFCFHPEWPDDSAQRQETSCTNFIIPPQSVFISGKGGQYDILVSAYSQFAFGSNNPPSVLEWLRNNGGEIQLYDQNGFVKSWTPSWDGGSGWNSFDQTNGDLCLTEGSRENSVDAMKHKMFYAYTNVISTVWTPLSIDTSNRSVLEWHHGNTGADFRYFSDLFTSNFYFFSGVGGGTCWERTCGGTNVEEGGPVFPAHFESGTRVCSGHGYGSAWDSLPACDSASRNECPSGSHCRTASPNSGTTCIQRCTSDSQCAKGGFCGGVAGVCGTGEVNTGR